MCGLPENVSLAVELGGPLRLAAVADSVVGRHDCLHVDIGSWKAGFVCMVGFYRVGTDKVKSDKGDTDSYKNILSSPLFRVSNPNPTLPGSPPPYLAREVSDFRGQEIARSQRWIGFIQRPERSLDWRGCHRLVSPVAGAQKERKRWLEAVRGRTSSKSSECV